MPEYCLPPFLRDRHWYDTQKVASKKARMMTTHHDGQPASERNEKPAPIHPDAIEMIEHLDVPHQDAIENNEHLSPANSEGPIRINNLGNPLGISSGEGIPDQSDEARRQVEADELWDALKAETGCSSYVDYLETYRAKRAYMERVLDHLTPAFQDEYTFRESNFTILDLSYNEESVPRVFPRFNDTSAVRIVTALRQPPANVTVQILLWNSAAYLHQDVVNPLGWGLKIDPRFFGALCGRNKRHLDPQHVIIDGAVATVVRHYAVPIVLIARMGWDSALTSAVEEEIGDVFPFQYPAVTTYLPYPYFTPVQDQKRVWGRYVEGHELGKYEHPNYTHLLNWFLGSERNAGDRFDGMFLKPLIPLIYLSIFRVRECCESIRQQYYELQIAADDGWWAEKDKAIFDLPKDRVRLRALVEDLEDGYDQTLGFLDSQPWQGRYRESACWGKVTEDFKRTHREAARLEAQIRHYRQLQIGESALQESKQSIELSNRQIEEGKGVKIFTVLAFVYVPLNLATSIFGMNLSELNGSGKSIWVFLTTAVIALLITGVLWFLMREVNNYLRWRRRSHDASIDFTIGARISMLAWLQGNQVGDWMWRSGAWWRILVNSDSRLRNPGEARGLNTCEFVSKYGCHPHPPHFRPFEHGDSYEWDKTTSETKRWLLWI